MVSAHFLYLGKVEFMEEGTPPAYTFPSYTTYTPPHNPVITGTLIDDVLASVDHSFCADSDRIPLMADGIFRIHSHGILNIKKKVA
jgi:hypothetical protein